MSADALEVAAEAVSAMTMVDDQYIQQRERADARTANLMEEYRDICERIDNETQNYKYIEEAANRRDPSCWLDSTSNELGMVYLDIGDTRLEDLARIKNFTFHAVSRDASLKFTDDCGIVFDLHDLPNIAPRQTPSMKGYFAWDPKKHPRSLGESYVRYMRERVEKTSPDRITVHTEKGIAEWCRLALLGEDSATRDGGIIESIICDDCRDDPFIHLVGRDWTPVTLCEGCSGSDHGALSDLVNTIAGYIYETLDRIPNCNSCKGETCDNGVITADNSPTLCSACDPTPATKSAKKC